MTEVNSFKFFDHLFSDPKKSCKVMEEMQQEGSDWNQTGGMLYWGLKNYLIILDFSKQGISDNKRIASEGKMNPYSVMNLLKHRETLLEKELFITMFFKELVALDYDIKMGRVPAEYFRLRVKELVLMQ